MPTKTKAELETENYMLFGQLESIHEQISEILYATCDDKTKLTRKKMTMMRTTIN
ncbi:MAG: hypothetical protein H0W63_03020 [Gemmatimonadaceae bacterium]|nr:hypothetical protein [Gemmatimonadaceae bacterium]